MTAHTQYVLYISGLNLTNVTITSNMNTQGSQTSSLNVLELQCESYD